MSSTSFTKKYVRRPLYVEAVQVREDNFADIVRWCFGRVQNIDGSPVEPTAELDPHKQYINVRVLDPKNARQRMAYLGDWILYTERGYKVYAPKAFQANFDPVEDD